MGHPPGSDESFGRELGHHLAEARVVVIERGRAIRRRRRLPVAETGQRQTALFLRRRRRLWDRGFYGFPGAELFGLAEARSQSLFDGLGGNLDGQYRAVVLLVVLD